MSAAEHTLDLFRSDGNNDRASDRPRESALINPRCRGRVRDQAATHLLPVSAALRHCSPGRLVRKSSERKDFAW